MNREQYDRYGNPNDANASNIEIVNHFKKSQPQHDAKEDLVKKNFMRSLNEAIKPRSDLLWDVLEKERRKLDDDEYIEQAVRIKEMEMKLQEKRLRVRKQENKLNSEVENVLDNLDDLRIAFDSYLTNILKQFKASSCKEIIDDINEMKMVSNHISTAQKINQEKITAFTFDYLKQIKEISFKDNETTSNESKEIKKFYNEHYAFQQKLNHKLSKRKATFDENIKKLEKMIFDYSDNNPITEAAKTYDFKSNLENLKQYKSKLENYHLKEDRKNEHEN